MKPIFILITMLFVLYECVDSFRTIGGCKSLILTKSFEKNSKYEDFLLQEDKNNKMYSLPPNNIIFKNINFI